MSDFESRMEEFWTKHREQMARITGLAIAAAAKASGKFPQPNYVALKVAEEAGEVVRAAVHYAEGRATWKEVEDEVIQMIAMGLRLVTEGDQVNGVIPPNEISAKSDA